MCKRMYHAERVILGRLSKCQRFPQQPSACFSERLSFNGMVILEDVVYGAVMLIGVFTRVKT